MADNPNTAHKNNIGRLSNGFKRNLARMGQNRKVAALSIVLFAIVGVGSLLFANAAQIKDENTVILSNGQEIRLNESTRRLSRKLGNDLVKLNDSQYEYPGPGQDVEVIIDVDRNRVVAIHLAESANTTLEGNNSVGVNLTDAARRSSKTRNAKGDIADLYPKNLVIERSKASEYLLVDTCQNPNTAGVVSIALKGYEERVSRQWNAGECFDD